MRCRIVHALQRRTSPNSISPSGREDGRAVAPTSADERVRARLPEPSDGLAAALSRAVARRVTRPSLQRAIIAIDGPNDDAAALASTRSCLANLQQKARGNVAGPDVLPSLTNAPALASTDETIYILGHGSRGGTVAGLSPDAMGRQLRRWYAGQQYTGAIRLVACHSAWTGTGPLYSGGPNITVTRSYADRLATWLGNNPSRTFRPTSVQGLLGIGWVRPDTGKQMSIVTDTYRGLSSADKTAFTTGDFTEFSRVSTTLGGAVTTGAAAKVRYNVPYTFLGNAWGALKGTLKDVTSIF